MKLLKLPFSKGLPLALDMIHELSVAGHSWNVSFLDNYNWRVLAIGEKLRSIWSDFEINPKRNGVDGKTKSFPNIEIKTSSKRSPVFVWSNQYNPIHRRRALNPNAFVFAKFQNERLLYILVAKEEKTVSHVKSQLKDLQDDYVRGGERNISSVGMDLKTLLNGEVVWDFYMNSTWRSSTSSADVKRQLSL